MKARTCPIQFAFAFGLLLTTGCREGERGRAAPGTAEITGPVTFNEHVAPILHQHCAPCHWPGGAAPHSLLTYEETEPLAPLIAVVTANRKMPPWLPAPDIIGFADDRSLGDHEIDLLRRWAESGTRGDNSVRVTPPPPPEDWPLGEPDLIVRMAEPYQPEMGRHDVFRNIVIPVPVQGVKYVRAVDLQPGSPKVVHHAQIMVDSTGTSRQIDAADPEPGFDGMVHAKGAENPRGFFLGWTPGMVPFEGSEEMAWPISDATDLVLMLHLRPKPESEPIQAQIGLYFADKPPTRIPQIIKLGSPTIDIAPGESDYTVEDSYQLPVDVYALRVYPHAHYLGKRMEGYAILPDGTKRWLLLIEDWDFNWQDEYRYAEPIFLPKGSRLIMRFTFDNSADNPQNPNHPPVRVVYGPESKDEMGEFLLQVLPRNNSDAAALRDNFRQKELRWQTELLRHLLRFEPDDPSLHYQLALNLQWLGTSEESAAEYERALALDPDDDMAHNNLGTVLQELGRLQEATRHYQQSLELNPTQASVHTNLGSALQALGDQDGAMRHYRSAIELDPDYPQARGRLAFALAQQGKIREALDHFREAIRLDPDWVAPRFGAAWALATDSDSTIRDPAEALRLAKSAAEMSDRRDATVLDALAAAYAATGDFDQAVSVGEEAYWLAIAKGQESLARTIESHMRLYRRGEPFVQPAR
jgi:tetratricopeptide (TPR) repeat protein